MSPLRIDRFKIDFGKFTVCRMIKEISLSDTTVTLIFLKNSPLDPILNSVKSTPFPYGKLCYSPSKKLRAPG
jgi:hypothetical protein